MNKAKYIRETLGLSKAQAGRLLCGHPDRGNQAANAWRRIETGQITLITSVYLDLLIKLIDKRVDIIALLEKSK